MNVGELDDDQDDMGYNEEDSDVPTKKYCKEHHNILPCEQCDLNLALEFFLF